MSKSSVINSSDDSCRRDYREDRRKNHVKALGMSFVKRRRRGPRRGDDSQYNHYTDFHEPLLFFMTVGILVLCVVDAFFTLTILSMGGEEVNPFMKMLLEKDVLLFFVVKFLLTSVFLIFTVIHKRFRLFNRISGYQIIYSVFVLYVMLVIYELFLLFA